MEPWRTARWNSLDQNRISHEALQFIFTSLNRGSHLDELSSVTGQGQMIWLLVFSPQSIQKDPVGKKWNNISFQPREVAFYQLSFLARSTFYFLLLSFLYKRIHNFPRELFNENVSDAMDRMPIFYKPDTRDGEPITGRQLVQPTMNA